MPQINSVQALILVTFNRARHITVCVIKNTTSFEVVHNNSKVYNSLFQEYNT